MRHHRHRTGEHQRHLAAQHIGQRRRQSLVRHMTQFDTRHHDEQLSGQMGRAADAIGGVIDLPRIGLGERHQILHRFHRQGRMHHHQQRRLGEQTDRLKILQRIIGRLLLHIRNDRHRRHVRQQQRITIRRRLGREFGRDHAARPGPVVDGELLLERAGQLLPDHARHGVVATTGRLRHQHTHGFHRIALRQHADRRQPQRHQQRHTRFIFHLHFPSVMS